MKLLHRPLVAIVAAAVCLGVASPARAADPAPVAVTAPTTMVTSDGQVVVVVPTPPGTTIAVLPPLPPSTPLYAPMAPLQVVPPPPVQTQVRPVAGPTALVHLNGPASLTLEGVLPGDTTWRPVCGAPCDVAVPLDALFRVTAPSSQPTRAFRLAAVAGERVVLDADPTSEGTHAGGEALMVGGGVGIIGGGVILYADLLASAACYEASCGGSRGAFFTGVGAMAVGAAALIAGIALIQPSSVQQSTTSREPGAGPTASKDRWLRAPIWREASPEADALPRSMSIPLLTRSF